MIRRVETGAELESWVRVRNAVEPNAPVSAEQLLRSPSDDRVFLLAELDGAVAGCGTAARSHFGGRCFLVPRVLEEFRGRGVGTALVRALAAHGRSLGLELGSASVDGADERSLAFAHRFGFEEVDREVEQVRTLGVEPPPLLPDGVELATIAARPELLEAAYPVAAQGYADMPVPAQVRVPLDEWLRDEATVPAGSFVALRGGEVVGYAGLVDRAEAGTAEHGLTVVRRDLRRGGIGTALKRAQLQWAAANGLHELVTWTQRGNEAMQALNERLGYRLRTASVRVWGPLQ